MIFSHYLIYNNYISAIALVAIGCISGFLAGLFGIGGGIVTAPAFSMLGVPLEIASATNLLQVLFSSLISSIKRFREKAINFKVVFLIIIFVFLGNICGIKLMVFFKLNHSIDKLIAVFFIIVMFFISIINFYDSLKKNHKTNYIADKLNKNMKIILTTICGFTAGFLMPIMGIGGGVIVVPFLIKVLGFNKNQAVCTSTFQMLISSCFTVVFGYFNNMHFDFLLLIFTLPGSFFAVRFGAKYSKNIPERTFKLLFGFLTLLISLFFVCKI
jgi:uncharacterized membrane protein YfcA